MATGAGPIWSTRRGRLGRAVPRRRRSPAQTGRSRRGSGDVSRTRGRSSGPTTKSRCSWPARPRSRPMAGFSPCARVTSWLRRRARRVRGASRKRSSSSSRSTIAARSHHTSDPYGSLDPRAERGDHLPLLAEASSGRVVLRGLRKRCPRCGARAIWLTWFNPKPRCPVCDLRFEAEEGGFLGAMVINYTFACSFWIAAMVITMILTVPFIPVLPVIAGSVAILGGLPVWFYPRSKLLWAAVEFLTARSEPGYRTPTARDPRARDLE